LIFWGWYIGWSLWWVGSKIQTLVFFFFWSCDSWELVLGQLSMIEMFGFRENFISLGWL
jgi:hypothetical protein